MIRRVLLAALRVACRVALYLFADGQVDERKKAALGPSPAAGHADTMARLWRVHDLMQTELHERRARAGRQPTRVLHRAAEQYLGRTGRRDRPNKSRGDPGPDRQPVAPGRPRRPAVELDGLPTHGRHQVT